MKKFIHKGDIPALIIVLATTAITGLTYLMGKYQGRIDAYGEVTEALEEAVKEVSKTNETT